MELDEIPANMQLTLTPELNRLFLYAHCEPTCHSCFKSIEVGEMFTLVSVDGYDTMIGACCTMEKLIAARLARNKARIAANKGYSRVSRPLKAQEAGQ